MSFFPLLFGSAPFVCSPGNQGCFDDKAALPVLLNPLFGMDGFMVSCAANTLVIKVDGFFSLNQYFAFQKAIFSWDGGGFDSCVVDLAGTTQIDSFGLGILRLLHKHAGPNKGSVLLSGASPELDGVLRGFSFDAVPGIG